jgi:hypothetical protein
LAHNNATSFFQSRKQRKSCAPSGVSACLRFGEDFASADPDHGFFKSWLEKLANGLEPFALSPLVACAFVRIVTNPAFRPSSTPLPLAVAVVESLLHVRSYHPPHHVFGKQGSHTKARRHGEMEAILGIRVSDAGKYI